MQELVFILNADLKIDYCNQSVRKFNSDFKNGYSFLKGVSPKDLKRLNQKLRASFNSSKSNIIVKGRLQSGDKSDAWHVISIKQVQKNTEHIQLIIIATATEKIEQQEMDMLEREAALADSEKLGRIGSWWVNKETKENHWSQGNFDIWGYDSNLPPPNVHEILKQLHPDDSINILNAIENVGKTVESQDLTFRIMKDGKPNRYFVTRIRPWYIDGELKEVKGVNVEITDIVKAQNELQEKLTLISHHNEKLAEYIWINSHEIRRPMSNILGLIELAKNDNLTLEELIAILEKEAVQMDKVIQKINLALSNEESILGQNLE
ncbi:MAG: hypothetical protein JXR07_02140 [Reichenbachiella sp.]